MTAENTQHNNQQATPAIPGAEHTAASTAEGHGGAVPKDQIFSHLLGELGDHPTFNIWGYKIVELPKIFIDNGVHFYSSPKTMEQAGVFTYKEHQVVKKDTGHAPALDLSVSNLVMFQWIAMVVVLIMFFIAGRRAKKNPTAPPKGVQNLLEIMIEFIHDEIVSPNIPSKKAVKKFMPYFIALFFFILSANLIGLIPGMHTSTGALGTTLALAVTAFIIINFTAMWISGVKAWFKHLLGGAPIALAPIMIPIEIISLLVKPFALTIRLFANMTAGHVILLSLVGLIFFFKAAMGVGAGVAISFISVAFSVFMYTLELLVALLQAYVFTILTAVFTGLAIGSHSHEHAH
jgi:F-type H+-transporting ATPase subunit a